MLAKARKVADEARRKSTRVAEEARRKSTRVAEEARRKSTRVAEEARKKFEKKFAKHQPTTSTSQSHPESAQEPEFVPGQFQSLCHGQRAIAAATTTQRGVVWSEDGMDDFEKGFMLLGAAELDHQQCDWASAYRNYAGSVACFIRIGKDIAANGGDPQAAALIHRKCSEIMKVAQTIHDLHQKQQLNSLQVQHHIEMQKNQQQEQADPPQPPERRFSASNPFAHPSQATVARDPMKKKNAAATLRQKWGGEDDSEQQPPKQEQDENKQQQQQTAPQSSSNPFAPWTAQGEIHLEQQKVVEAHNFYPEAGTLENSASAVAVATVPMPVTQSMQQRKALPGKQAVDSFLTRLRAVKVRGGRSEFSSLCAENGKADALDGGGAGSVAGQYNDLLPVNPVSRQQEQQGASTVTLQHDTYSNSNLL